MSNLIQIKRKIILVGYPAVGKTSLTRRYVLDEFSDKYMVTMGFKIYSKQVIYDIDNNGNFIELTQSIWDIMGQTSYKLAPENAFLNAKGAILVCDLTRRHTLDLLVDLTTELFNITEDMPLVFIANKKDLVDQIRFSEAELADIAKAFDAPYFLTSAKTSENVEEAFITIGRKVLEKQGTL